MLTFFWFFLVPIMSWPGYWNMSLILGLSFFLICLYKFLEESFNKFMSESWREWVPGAKQNDVQTEEIIKLFQKYPNLLSLFSDKRMLQIFPPTKQKELISMFFLSLAISLIGIFWNFSLFFLIVAGTVVSYILLHVLFAFIVTTTCKILKIQKPVWRRFPWEPDLQK